MRRGDTERPVLGLRGAALAAHRTARTAAALAAAVLLGAPGAARAQVPAEFSAASTDPEGRESGFSAIALRTQALRLAIEYPERGQEIASPDGRGFITGTAYQTRTRGPDEYDVFVAIDVSSSTRRPCGSDVDGDGRVGSDMAARGLPLLSLLLTPASSDPGDSVLACEIKAAKTLLSQLDPLSTRVGVIAFSGTRDMRRSGQPDARIAVPLTRDYDEVAARLDDLAAAGPQAETNLLAAVQLASVEFEREVLAKPKRRVQRLLLLISDGRATLPAALSARERAGATLEAARDAAAIPARIDTYAVGRDDPEAMATLRGIAEATQGSFERVAQPADLVARFQMLDLAQLEQLEVRNLTISAQSDDVLIDAYGAFSAIVPLREGRNELEVFARSRSGSEDRERFTVVYRRDAGLPVLPVRALERRARLLEDRLRQAYLEDMERVRARRERSRNVEVRPADPLAGTEAKPAPGQPEATPALEPKPEAKPVPRVTIGGEPPPGLVQPERKPAANPKKSEAKPKAKPKSTRSRAKPQPKAEPAPAPPAAPAPRPTAPASAPQARPGAKPGPRLVGQPA